jgi:hypothetical protein
MTARTRARSRCKPFLVAIARVYVALASVTSTALTVHCRGIVVATPL